MAASVYPNNTFDGQLFLIHDWKISRWEGPNTPPTPFFEHRGWLNWAPWEDKVVFENNERGGGGTASIDVYDAVTGTTTTLLELADDVDVDGIAVSPDGMWVYYDQRVLRGTDIMLVENFAP